MTWAEIAPGVVDHSQDSPEDQPGSGRLVLYSP